MAVYLKDESKSAYILTVLSLCLFLASCDSSSDDPDVTPTPDAAPTQEDSVYLNIENISVVEGANSTPSLNNTVSLNNVIDAPSADAFEVHTQESHVWHTGPKLELLFDLQRDYIVEEVHFWNYNDEDYDVDNVILVFSDSMNNMVGELAFNPELGVVTDNGVASENIDLELGSAARFVTATITGSNNESDFQNIGFTARVSQ